MDGKMEAAIPFLMLPQRPPGQGAHFKKIQNENQSNVNIQDTYTTWTNFNIKIITLQIQIYYQCFENKRAAQNSHFLTVNGATHLSATIEVDGKNNPNGRTRSIFQVLCNLYDKKMKKNILPH